MNKNTLILIFIAIFIVIGATYYYVILPQDTSTELPSASYTDGTTTVEAVFDVTSDTVTFTHPSVGTITLPQAISGSGARYANEDESIVFWEHQGEATITKSGETVFQGAAN